MSKAQYDIYRRKVLDLARTLVVKSSASADAINRELRALGLAINENDPESWKYYLHLAGEYHSTSVLMTVKSLDTLTDIPFTKDSLVNHLATMREYRQFGSYYRALVSRYPDQEDLIRGILNPVDIDAAIAAEDGQILYFDPELVESNEENLIPKLESWCKVFSRRWLVRAYAQVDDLYVPAHLTLMYMLIPSVVMNIRLANCHTNYAHSYHIREYLASHQKLDWAVDYMTKQQMLWLYREIRFIERNAGKQSTFKSLIQHILTERSLPLAEWNMRHSLTEMPEELTPRVEFVRETLNLDLSAAGVETRNVVEMLNAEEIVAKGNSRVMEDAAPQIREQMEYSGNDELKTKILESAVLDTTDATIYTLADTLLNHWLYLSHAGRYTAVLTVDNPRTGQPLVLSVKEAFVVFLYSCGQAMGLEMHNLPILPANNVRRLITPPRSKLEGMVDKKLRNPAVFDAIYANIVPIGNYISTEAFYRDISSVHKGLMAHRWIWATREHKEERGMVEGAAMHLYHTISCDLGSSQTFDRWFADRGLDMPQFTRLEHELLANLLVSHATGANLNITTSLREIQAAMLRIMATLSSYSVQYLQSINSQPLLVTDWPMPRIGKVAGRGGDHIEGVAINIGVTGIKDKGRVRDRLITVDEEMTVKVKGHVRDRVEFNLGVTPHGSVRWHYKVEMANPTVLRDHFPESQLADVTDRDTDSYVPFGGVLLRDAFSSLDSRHYALDTADRNKVTTDWTTRSPDPKTDYSLPGLRYPPVLPVVTSVDLFDMPDAPIESDLELDGFFYPDYELVVRLDVLFYPTLNGSVIADTLTYPELNASVVSDRLVYPTLNEPVYADALTYPDLELDLTLDKLDYPDVERIVRIQALSYPIFDGQTMAEQLTYPSVT